MSNPKPNPAREHRIEHEIVVDAYGKEERALSWYYYLEDKLQFPFRAKCAVALTVSPLEKGKEVEVIGMAPEDNCMQAMLVLIWLADRTLGVRLDQLEAITGGKATHEAIADWRYWCAMGYVF
jgi:hypothetical protein